MRPSAWAIYDVFETRDGEQVFVGVVSDSLWQKFCEAFELRELGANADYRLNNQRVLARDVLLPQVREVFRQFSKAELVAMAQQALSTGERKEAEFRGAPPFLNALADALNGPEQTQSRFVYSGRAYHLSIKQAPDAKAAEYFQKRRIIAAGAKVIRAAGKLRRESGGNETDFHLWVAQGEARKLPLRIEYQPKSFLRLTFEAEA